MIVKSAKNNLSRQNRTQAISPGAEAGTLYASLAEPIFHYSFYLAEPVFQFLLLIFQRLFSLFPGAANSIYNKELAPITETMPPPPPQILN
jgi:hypothetical protein